MFNLLTAMQPVIRGEAYYACRPRGPRKVTDPDGRERDMRSDDEAALWAQTRSLPLSWLPQNATVLDVGCGPGKLKLARPDLTVWGYEPDLRDMEAAQVRGVLDIADGHASPLDALFCMDVVEHMGDPFGDLARWLTHIRTGGLVIVEAPDFGGPIAQEWGERYRLLDDPDHVSLFTQESLIRMLRDLGVIIDEVAFPFFGGPYDGVATWDRLSRRDLAKSSPPFPGNLVAVRGRKR